MADPEISDPLADPDGDGLNDLGEYAYNLNPLVADRNTAPTGDRGMPRAALDQDHLEITFVRRKPPVDLIYDIAHGTDLQSWADALAPPPHLTLDSAVDVGPPGTLERVTYRTTQPIAAGNGSHYLRLRVRQTP